ncbi:MAG: 16S rRNA (guanine(527)-N(7))-methyltransferase RsmG [Hyphomicrobiales bacterium]
MALPGDVRDSIDIVSEIVPVSRETGERLSIYVELLRHWQKSLNLVAPSTLEAVWSRHVADSAQIIPLVPGAKRWVDIGSGAGFPGLVTAIFLADVVGAEVNLVESNGKKAAFLRTVARETGAPAKIHCARIEDVIPTFQDRVDAVSARALASLSQLCGMVEPLVRAGAVAVFHKGQDFAAEYGECAKSWNVDLVKHQSRIDPKGSVIVIRGLTALSTRNDA